MARMENANRSVLVGVPAGASEEDGTPLAMIAATHEFGDPERNIPERPVLRQGVRNGAAKFVRVNAASLRKVLRGEMSVEQAVDKLGVLAVGEVKREFTQPNPPLAPLKPATIDARKRKFGKSSTRPLVASGQYRQSVTHQLEGTESANAKVVE